MIDALSTLAQQGKQLAADVAALTPNLRGHHVIFEATLQPESWAPSALLRKSRLHIVGLKQSPDYSRTLLVSGRPEDVQSFANKVAKPSPLVRRQIRKFSSIEITKPIVKQTDREGLVIWEATLSQVSEPEVDAGAWASEHFEKWALHVESLGGMIDRQYRRDVGEPRGLTFVAVSFKADVLNQITKFNLLRAIRPMGTISLRDAGLLFVPAASVTESAFGTLIEQGVLGALCVLLIVAVAWSIRGWLKEKDNRLNDQKLMAEARQKDNDALKQLTVELKGHSAQITLDVTRSHNDMAHSLNKQEDALEDLRGAVDSLRRGSR